MSPLQSAEQGTCSGVMVSGQQERETVKTESSYLQKTREETENLQVLTLLSHIL